MGEPWEYLCYFRKILIFNTFVASSDFMSVRTQSILWTAGLSVLAYLNCQVALCFASTRLPQCTLCLELHMFPFCSGISLVLSNNSSFLFFDHNLVRSNVLTVFPGAEVVVV